MIDNKLYEYMYGQVELVPTDFTRYKYPEIDCGGRLVGILGLRGIVKSPTGRLILVTTGS